MIKFGEIYPAHALDTDQFRIFNSPICNDFGSNHSKNSEQTFLKNLGICMALPKEEFITFKESPESYSAYLAALAEICVLGGLSRNSLKCGLDQLILHVKTRMLNQKAINK